MTAWLVEATKKKQSAMKISRDEHDLTYKHDFLCACAEKEEMQQGAVYTSFARNGNNNNSITLGYSLVMRLFFSRKKKYEKKKQLHLTNEVCERFFFVLHLTRRNTHNNAVRASYVIIGRNKPANLVDEQKNRHTFFSPCLCLTLACS